MSDLPTRLRIGGLVYRVTRPADPWDEAPMGRCHFRRALIEIAPDLSAEQARSTLLHEALEALNHAHQWELPHATLQSIEHAVDALLAGNADLMWLYAKPAEDAE